MTKLQKLNRHMLGLEKAGHLTEEEYATYRNLLAAANHLAECQELVREYPWVHQECKRILKELG